MIYILSNSAFTPDELATLGLPKARIKRNVFQSERGVNSAYEFSKVARLINNPFCWSSIRGKKLTTLLDDVPLDFFLLKASSKDITGVAQLDSARFLTPEQKALIFDIEMLCEMGLPNTFLRMCWTATGAVPPSPKDLAKHADAVNEAQRLINARFQLTILLRDTIKWVVKPSDPPLPSSVR